VAEQLDHVTLAETHDLVIGFTFGIEVRATLAPTHGKGGQGVFEHLLKSQKLENPQIDRGVEPEPAFVGADGAVHLNAIAPVDLNAAPVVLPADPELDDPLGFGDALQNLFLPVTRITVQDRLHRLHHLTHGLVKFSLVRISGLDERHDVVCHCETPRDGSLTRQ